VAGVDAARPPQRCGNSSVAAFDGCREENVFFLAVEGGLRRRQKRCGFRRGNG
jgi:hypothetical protein